MRKTFALGGALLWCVALTAHAEMLMIKPVLVDSSDTVQQALDENAGHASTSIEGDGQALFLGYSANEAITVFMVPLDSHDSYAPTDFLRFTLPAAGTGEVLVDLTVSPGWSPGERKYLLNMLSKTGDAAASFTRLEFMPSTVGSDLAAAATHLFTPEAYLPSSYHALRGYRIFGQSVSFWLGILCVILALIAAAVRPKGTKLSAMLIVFVCGSFLYSLRFAMDELSFTTTHLDEYSHGMYDEAGSVRLIAEVLSASTDRVRDSVFVCRDGTNFKEKLLKYFAYPLKITSDPADAGAATYAIVMDKHDWSIDTVIDGNGSRQTLRCGPLKREGEKIATFDDGSMLFRFPAAR